MADTAFGTKAEACSICVVQLACALGSSGHATTLRCVYCLDGASARHLGALNSAYGTPLLSYPMIDPMLPMSGCGQPGPGNGLWW